MIKATRKEIEARVAAIFSLLVAGASTKECLEYARRSWGVTRAPAQVYLARAREDIKTCRIVDREYELSRELLRRDSLYKQALQKEGVRSALAVADSRCQLLGLFSPTKIEIATEGASFEHLTKEQARQALDALASLTTPGAVPAPAPKRRPKSKARAGKRAASK